MQAMLSVRQGRGIACMCAFGVSVFLVCVGRRARRACMLRGVWGGVPAAPRGDPNLPLSFHTFLKGLCSFYLRKRDQPVGKWGRSGGGGGNGRGGRRGWGGGGGGGAECYDTATLKCNWWGPKLNTRENTHRHQC